jgi:mannitol/fructose-specific phosphotransferase system IIA component (Ntr-type)
MTLTEILDSNCIRVPLEAANKTGAITELVDALDRTGILGDRDQTLRAILSREETRSTGIGEGLAVPHGKTNGCRRLALAVGRPAAPIDFGSKDGKPCQIIFLLASPIDETGPHIQALARISRLWLTPEFRAAMLAAQNANDVFAAIERHQG